MSDHFFADAQRARVLLFLIARGRDGATTAELSDPAVGGHEGPRRARELRALGYPIHRRPLDNGWWLYWLRQPGEHVTRQLDLSL